MDADGGRGRRTRHRPRADRRQRRGRGRHLRDASAAPLEASASLLLPQWQDSVVALWTSGTHASGFVIDAKGSIATNQRAIGTATSVEVQLAPAVKVTASVLAADPGAGCRGPLDRSGGHRIGSARPAGMRIRLRAAACGRAGDLHNRQSAPPAEGHDVRNREPRGPARHRVRPGSPRAAAWAARSSQPTAASLASPRSQTTRTRAAAGTSESSAPTRRAKSWRRPRRRWRLPRRRARAHLPVEPALPFPLDALKDAAATPRGQPEPVPDVIVRLRYRVHHARA